MATLETLASTELAKLSYTKSELVEILDSIERDVRHNGGRHVKFALESSGDDFGDTVILYAQGYRVHKFKSRTNGPGCAVCDFKFGDEIHDPMP